MRWAGVRASYISIHRADKNLKFISFHVPGYFLGAGSTWTSRQPCEAWSLCRPSSQTQQLNLEEGQPDRRSEVTALAWGSRLLPD